ncbi:Peptide N-acetyl-beta-D-glucosaminyl asparaginase amidase A [Microdochium nivale]|nr:Peptide N-acetyl-beta-D-glucosaminyl asparaginase amidase A [Microdochium nivale]
MEKLHTTSATPRPVRHPDFRQRRAGQPRALLLLALALALLYWYHSPSVDNSGIDAQLSPGTEVPILECFQVAQPVVVDGRIAAQAGRRGIETAVSAPGASPPGSKSCTVQLMDHVFGWSYGKPFVGAYIPPNCQFNRVITSLTVVSEGRQFDRLALMFFTDTEVWRTSTAEPVKHPGIRWTVTKDLSHMAYLWKSPQTLIFDLGNLVDDKYTGTFNATLTATFYQSPTQENRVRPADLIVPISAGKSALGQASHFLVPRDQASGQISIPRNTNRAMFTIAAVGQAAEEFWWSNVLETDKTTFARTYDALPGLSPFREVQLLIDGQLAGVSWPFPVIFTGGVTPSLHRPVVGLQAFDLREHQIDITPWLPRLCDGMPHDFSIRVVGIQDDGTDQGVLSDHVGASWYVTGKIFLWLDEDSASVTTGTMTEIPAAADATRGRGDQPAIHISRALFQNATGFNETLSFEVGVHRKLAVGAHIRSQHGGVRHVRWAQQVDYANVALVADYGFRQVNDFIIKGLDSAQSSANHHHHFETAYEYPLACNQNIVLDGQGGLAIRSSLLEGLQLRTRGAGGVFPTGAEGYDHRHHGDNDTDDDNSSGGGSSSNSGTYLQTVREGNGEFFAPGGSSNKASSGSGWTRQLFYFGALLPALAHGQQPWPPAGRADKSHELYFRNVTAVNGSVVSDCERCLVVSDSNGASAAAAEEKEGFDSSHRDAPPPVEHDGAGKADPVEEDNNGGDELLRVQPPPPPPSLLWWSEYAEPLAARRLLGGTAAAAVAPWLSGGPRGPPSVAA